MALILSPRSSLLLPAIVFVSCGWRGNPNVAAFQLSFYSAISGDAFCRPTALAEQGLKATMTENDGTETGVDPATSFPPLTKTAKRLFLVRHGEVINPGGDRPVYYGAMDVPLSPLGQKEAKAAADYLQQIDLKHVFSSPLKRAVYGAEKVLEKQKELKADTGVTIFDGFKELDRGDWCGRTKEEIGADQMARFDTCDESVTPVGGESYPALKRRVLEALFGQVLPQMQGGEAACIVSHLQVTRSILSQALKIPTNEMSTLKVATASITCIDYEKMENEKEQVSVDDKLGSDTKVTVHFQSFKPDIGLEQAKDGAN